jgi:hypothetical protein
MLRRNSSALNAGMLVVLAIAASVIGSASVQAQYIGNYTANPYLPPAPPQPPGTFNNQYGNSTNSPHLYDSQGQYRGNLNANPYWSAPPSGTNLRVRFPAILGFERSTGWHGRTRLLRDTTNIWRMILGG